MSDVSELLNIMSALRDPESGCPWDIKQTFETIVPYTLEEAYEVAESIEQQDFDELKLELGDLLFQVVFYAQLGKEQQLFEFDDIVAGLCEKLVRRHPHVFASDNFDEAQVKENWEKEKAKERAAKARQHSVEDSVLDNIPLSLPALSRSQKLQKRCANVGFDWPDVSGAIAKVKEEIAEVEQELERDEIDNAALGEELGDLFFALVNVSRHLNHNAESLLRSANQKFERRFRQVETMTKAQGLTVEDSTLQQLDNLWEAVKQMERE